MKKLFSERYGYTKPSDVIVREYITREIQNAICSCYDKLTDLFLEVSRYPEADYIELEKYLWINVLNERAANFSNGRSYHIVATNIIEDVAKQWYEKLDLVEVTLQYLRSYDRKDGFWGRNGICDKFINLLNSEFERLHFAYRIVNDDIVEIDSKEEVEAIEEALSNSSSTIRMHLSRALELYAQRPEGDYRNSIKESISAVEVYCREKTGENTLGKAINKLEQSGMVIPPVLKLAFEKLYAYTNQPDSGIRHALMDDSGAFTPKAEEALFMLVSCSAFINYLVKKEK